MKKEWKEVSYRKSKIEKIIALIFQYLIKIHIDYLFRSYLLMDEAYHYLNSISACIPFKKSYYINVDASSDKMALRENKFRLKIR